MPDRRTPIARAVRDRSGAEQWIDRRSRKILARAAAQEHAAVVEQQVQIGWSDIDATRLERQPVARKVGGQRARSIEDTTEHAVRTGGGVNHHEQRGGKVVGKVAQQGLQRLQGAR